MAATPGLAKSRSALRLSGHGVYLVRSDLERNCGFRRNPESESPTVVSAGRHVQIRSMQRNQGQSPPNCCFELVKFSQSLQVCVTSCLVSSSIDFQSWHGKIYGFFFFCFWMPMVIQDGWVSVCLFFFVFLMILIYHHCFPLVDFGSIQSDRLTICFFILVLFTLSETCWDPPCGLYLLFFVSKLMNQGIALKILHMFVFLFSPYCQSFDISVFVVEKVFFFVWLVFSEAILS